MNLRSLIPLRDRAGLARPEASPFGSLQREVDRLTAEQDVEGELLNGEMHAAVRSAVAELPAPFRRVIEREKEVGRPGADRQGDDERAQQRSGALGRHRGADDEGGGQSDPGNNGDDGQTRRHRCGARGAVYPRVRRTSTGGPLRIV